MSNRVYGLKRATPKMKYQHMIMVMDWKRDLANILANPEARHIQLEELKSVMPRFHDWYNDVYKLRAANRQAEYEQVIREKWICLTQCPAHPNQLKQEKPHDNANRN